MGVESRHFRHLAVGPRPLTQCQTHSAGAPEGAPPWDYVTIYEDKHFGGTGILLDVGKWLERASDLNDVVSSIEVPAGLVAMVFEHADSGGGYGISADFLETCADLAPLGHNDKISYVNVFRAQRPPELRLAARGRDERPPQPRRQHRRGPQPQQRLHVGRAERQHVQPRAQ